MRSRNSWSTLDDHMRRRMVATRLAGAGVAFVGLSWIALAPLMSSDGAAGFRWMALALAALATLAGGIVYLMRVGHRCVFHHNHTAALAGTSMAVGATTAIWLLAELFA